jgi:hypothetical protein
MLVYHDVEGAVAVGECTELFALNGWLGAWVNGVFSFHHFHSTAREVLGIVAGSAPSSSAGAASTSAARTWSCCRPARSLQRWLERRQRRHLGQPCDLRDVDLDAETRQMLPR